jgi:hypothetical protein
VTFYVTRHSQGGQSFATMNLDGSRKDCENKENSLEMQARWCCRWLEQSEARAQTAFRSQLTSIRTSIACPASCISSSETFEQVDWTDDISQAVVNHEALVFNLSPSSRRLSEGSESRYPSREPGRPLLLRGISVGRNPFVWTMGIDVWRSGGEGYDLGGWNVKDGKVRTLDCNISFANSRAAGRVLRCSS